MENNAEKTELELLQSRLAENPNDSEILTELAFYYLENPDGDKDLEFFKLAYQKNPCIETIHNYASWLSWEYCKHKQATTLQRQALDLKPKSFYPYFAFAQFHLPVVIPFKQSLDDTTVKILAENYEIACEKFADTPAGFHSYHRLWFIEMLNNFAVTTALIGDAKKAEILFSKMYRILQLPIEQKLKPQVNETEYKILLNHTRFSILKNNKKQAIRSLQHIQKSNEACPLDISELYAQLGDYQTAYELMKSQNFENIHESWQNIWYAIYQIDRERWRKMLKAEILDRQECIVSWQIDLKNPVSKESFNYIFPEDLKEYIDTTLVEISDFQKLLDSNTLEKPKTDIRQHFHYFYQCNFFGYPRGLNLKNDNNDY